MAKKSTAFRCTLCFVLLTSFSSKTLSASETESSIKTNETSAKLSRQPLTKSFERRANFNIIVQSNQTILSWSTMDVKDGKYLIYRSNDNVNFEKIGEKTIIGNAKEPSLYIFHDEEPAKGLNAYKLVKQDDAGGAKEIAVKSIFLDRIELNTLSNIPVPRINRI